MQVFKCKICGGSLTVTSKSRVAVCDYCGSKQVLPLFSDESAQLLYDRGNNYLRESEYDKAENIFNQLLALCPEHPEIYWDLVLCKYGVTFVQDPKTGKYVPTCNRTHYESILNDKNYQKVIQYADDEQTAYYQENAETINNIQKGILAVSKKEKPFDVFISYKETDSEGNRTKDSIAAQNLYEKLTESGYKVFFSRITLEDKIGTEYEPYIYAALYSSKVMLTVCSSKENIESPWVRNEWSRFLTLRQSDANKTLIPLYFDMSKADLPEEFDIFAAQDMSKEDFEQELLRGIKKMIPLPIMLAEKRKRVQKKLAIAGISVIILVILGGITSIPWLMKIPDYNNAMQLYYDQKYPEATWAFADLGDYKNSAEMEEKCESSWRNSLAITLTTLYDGAKVDGTYYIDTNGNLSMMDNNSFSDLKANEHGKITSLAPNGITHVIYEDGYVSNIPDNYADKDQWHNIVQLSVSFDYTTVALRADGTMLYGILVDDNLINDNVYQNHQLTSNEWMQPIKTWENITSFTWGYDSIGWLGNEGYGYDSACIIGLKNDGSAEVVCSDGRSFSCDISEAKEYITDFPITYEYIFDDLNDSKVVLNDSGTILISDTNMPILKNIVRVALHAAPQCAISKNGNVYEISQHYYDESQEKLVESYTPKQIDGIKVCTYDEWGALKRYEE